jgi:hypothetical protein
MLISTIVKIFHIIIGERGYFMIRYSIVVVYRCSMTILFIGLLGLFVAGIADAGVNDWTTTGPEGGNIFALAIDPNTPAMVYAGTYGGGVFKSTNDGGNWTAINTGLTNTYVYALAIDPDTPATVYAGTDAGVFKSTNGGGNWTAILTNTDVKALAIDPNTPVTIYAGTYGGGVFKSTNGGGSWTAINTGLTSTGVLALAIDPNTPATVYAGTWGGGVFKSTNGGGNWTAINTGLTSTGVTALAIDPMNANILYAGTDGNGVFKIEQETCPTPGVVSNPSPSNQATNVSTNPTLSWSGSSNADSYDVYFGTTSDPTTLAGSTTSTSFPLPGLNLNTTYYWKIVARNNCGQSTSGPVWSFSTVQPSTYTLTVTKSGTGGGTLTSSPAGINCGDDCSETYTKVQKVKLTAKAETNSTFTGWSGGGCTGTKTCTVTVNTAVTVTADFALKIPDISVAQTSLDFGSVKLGKKVTKTLKITNNGSASLVVALSGLEGTDFVIQGSSSVTIKSKKSYTLKVLFTPKSVGSETATLEVNSNDLDSPSIDISLSGTGQ